MFFSLLIQLRTFLADPMAAPGKSFKSRIHNGLSAAKFSLSNLLIAQNKDPSKTALIPSPGEFPITSIALTFRLSELESCFCLYVSAHLIATEQLLINITQLSFEVKTF